MNSTEDPSLFSNDFDSSALLLSSAHAAAVTPRFDVSRSKHMAALRPSGLNVADEEQTDDEVIRSRVLDSISTALQGDLNQSNLLSLPETEIQIALDEIWKCLEVPSVSDYSSGIDPHPSRNRIRRLLLKLVLKYHRLPAPFILKGVRCIETESRGSGAFADVYYGALDDQPVALKRLRVYSAVLDSEKLKQEHAFYRESTLWKNLCHEHIVSFLGISEDLFSGPQRSICMVSPWMVNGTIRRFLDDMKQRECLAGGQFVDAVDRLLYQISRGLEYLHIEGMVHGDLHSGNILIDASGNARIADFGMALIADATSYSYASVHGGGAIRWVAPELLAPEKFGLKSSRPTPTSDVYSFAFICIELYTGEKPFPELKDHQVMMRVLSGDRPPRPTLPDLAMSAAMWSVTTSCWAAKPDARPSSEEVAWMLDNMRPSTLDATVANDRLQPVTISESEAQSATLTVEAPTSATSGSHASSTMTLSSSGSLNFPSSSGTTPLATREELKGFRRQYMRTPLTGPGSGNTNDKLGNSATPIASRNHMQLSHGGDEESPQGPGFGIPSRRRLRVASLPSMKTPGVINERNMFAPNSSSGAHDNSINTAGTSSNAELEFNTRPPLAPFHLTLHPRRGGDASLSSTTSHSQTHSRNHNQATHVPQPGVQPGRTGYHGGDGLKSYKQAVLARKAPTQLNLVPRRRGTIHLGAVGGGLQAQAQRLALQQAKQAESQPSSQGQQAYEAQAQQETRRSGSTESCSSLADAFESPAMRPACGHGLEEGTRSGVERDGRDVDSPAPSASAPAHLSLRDDPHIYNGLYHVPLPPHFYPSPPALYHYSHHSQHHQEAIHNPYNTYSPYDVDPLEQYIPLSHTHAQHVHSSSTCISGLIPPGMDPGQVDMRVFHPYQPVEVKHRKRTTAKQLRTLEDVYKYDTKPNAPLRKKLAEELDMTSRGVQVWFQNRRAKSAAVAKKERFSQLAPPKMDGDEPKATQLRLTVRPKL